MGARLLARETGDSLREMSYRVLNQRTVARSRGLVFNVAADLGLTPQALCSRPLSRAGKRDPILRTLLFSLLLITSVAPATATTLVVGGPGSQFQSIQTAIDVAHPGDTVQVHAGTYTGNLTINKQITLEGLDHPTLRGEGVSSVVTVLADSCIIRGFIIEHSGGDLTREDSGILLKSHNNQIEDNVLRDILYGIYFYSSHNNTIRRNQIRGRLELEEGDRGAGLHLWNSPDNIIEDNNISEERDGMYIQSCNGNQIRRNRVTNLRYGLHYMFSDRNVFEDNFFSNNVAGAAIMYSNHIEFRRSWLKKTS